MAVLLVEHHVTDLDTWLHTYTSYAAQREQGGVKEAHVFQPDNDPQYIVVIHFFDTTEAAENFRTFLREQVWTSAAPGMGGDPRAMILHEVDAGP
jgi:hypothetical protein